MAAENLFQQYAQPVKSVADYSNDMDAQDLKRQQLVGATRQNALAALVAQQTQQTMADTAGDRAALSRAASGWNAQTPAETRIADLRNSGRPGLMSHADALEKSWLDRRKTDADIGKSAADAGKTTSETIDATLKRYRGHLDYISNPQDAARWMVAQYNDPATSAHMANAIPIEQALKNIPQDPQGFQQWRQQAAMGMDAYAKHVLESGKAAQVARNDLIGPDGKPNAAVLGAKSQIANAGKTMVSVGVNTEKTYAGHVAEGLAKNDVAALDTARTAPDRVNTARSIKSVLNSNNAITGTAAETRLALTKALSTAGIIDGTSTTATEDLVSMLNSQTLEAIKSSGLGSGQGFTDKDRQFLQDAKSGRIEINKATLLRMADLNEKAGVAAIEYGNKIAGRLKGNPALGSVGQDLSVEVPADALSKAIAAEAARRAAARGGK